MCLILSPPKSNLTCTGHIRHQWTTHYPCSYFRLSAFPKNYIKDPIKPIIDEPIISSLNNYRNIRTHPQTSDPQHGAPQRLTAWQLPLTHYDVSETITTISLMFSIPIKYHEACGLAAVKLGNHQERAKSLAVRYLVSELIRWQMLQPSDDLFSFG